MKHSPCVSLYHSQEESYWMYQFMEEKELLLQLAAFGDFFFLGSVLS